MEFMAGILMCIDDSFELLLQNVIFIFGFSAGSTQKTITMEEFFYFLDSLFRAVMSFVTLPTIVFNKLQSKQLRENPNFKCLGKRVDPVCIEALCLAIFQGKPSINFDMLQSTLK